MQTLPAYRAHLSGQYAAKTVSMYYGDVRELSVYLDGRKLQSITVPDLEQWVDTLTSSTGRHIERKTLNRKVSAVHSYFAWLHASEAITDDPSAALLNARVQSPLPDYLYESEVQTLYRVASKDPRTYLMVLLLLETGMKSQELHQLTRANVDTSNQYKPELWIKHTGKATRKDRKVALVAEFTQVYLDYIAAYDIYGLLFPFTDRFAQLLFAALKRQTGIQKALTTKTLRHTHVVRAYRRGEDPETIFDRIGLAAWSRPEADEMYTRLAGRGI
jgi:site-specific recombinase XerD